MKITIITVVKNNVKGIEKTIKSVFSQTQKNIEYIVIDSMSSDGTSNIISKYKKKLKHIREPDTGIYSAINKGMLIAKGEYLGLLHSGDVYYDNFSLEKAISFMNLKKLNASSYNMQYINKKVSVRYWQLPIKKLTKYNIFKLAHPTLILKKNLISNLSYSENYKVSGDLEFIINMQKLKKLKYGYNDCILQINQYGGISTSNKFILIKIIEDLIILKKNFPYIFIYIFLLKILSKVKSFFVKP